MRHHRSTSRTARNRTATGTKLIAWAARAARRAGVAVRRSQAWNASGSSVSTMPTADLADRQATRQTGLDQPEVYRIRTYSTAICCFVAQHDRLRSLPCRARRSRSLSCCCIRPDRRNPYQSCREAGHRRVCAFERPSGVGR
jgi:hypothetical protein